MMGTWGRSTAMDTGDTLPPSEMPPPAPLGPPPRTDSLDQWAACFQAIKGFENSMEGAEEEEEEPGNLDFSDMEDDSPPRPEALQRLLSNGHTALPTAPPAWSAQPSHPTPQPPAQMETWKPDLELIGSAKWGPSPSTAHNTCFESHTTASRMPAAETTTTATTTTGRPTTDYSMLTIQAPKNIVHPPSTAGQSSSAQTTPCGNNYDSDSDSGSSVASGGGGGGKITPSGGNSRKSGRRRTPADQERKRLKKNAREQRRANKINDQIANMRNILAESGVAVQSTKSSILYQAIELIRSLRGQIQDMEQQQEAPPAQPRPSTTTLPPPSSPACMSRNISFEGKTALPSDSSAMLQDPMGFLAPEPYRLLFRKSATPLAIACLGPNGRFIDCNIRFAEVFGISVDDLRQCSILNFAAPIDEEQAHSVLMAATRPSSNGVREGMTTPAVPEAPLELILTNMQGHRYLVRVSPLKDDQGTPAYLLLTPKAIFRSPQHPPPPATTAATTGLAPPPFPHMMGSVPPPLSAASSSSSSSFGSSSSLGSNVPSCPQPAPTMPAFSAHHM